MHVRRAAWITAASLLVSAVATAKPDKAEMDKLLAETDAIAAKVSSIRGLAIKRPIARGVMSRPEIEKRLLQRIDEEYPAAKLLGEEAAAKRFGLLPVDTDYKSLVIGLLGEQIAGFYDPVAAELYLADWIEASGQRVVMAHEIDHALQDQHFDLRKFLKEVQDDADQTLARQALVEGDGTALMVEYMLSGTGKKVDPWADDKFAEAMGNQAAMSTGAEAFDKAPLFIREAVMFPYIEGLTFVAFTRRHHPWSRIDEMFKKPPRSSEHILHPEKYFAGEKPIKVKAGALASLKKWKKLEDNVFGEAGFIWLLREHGVRSDRAEQAAAGWGGDRYAVYAPPGEDGKNIDPLLGVSVSVWDSETDAAEAESALKEIDKPGWTVTRKGTRVVLTVGTPPDGKKLASELAKTWK